MHRNLTILAAAGLAALAAAGCLDGSDGNDGTGDGSTPLRPASTVAGFDALLPDEQPTFADSLIIDGVRAGGEPVIAVLPSGTILVSAHPGWTHYHPSDEPHLPTELLLPANLQSYLWRSTDGGATWDHVDLIDGVDNVPRSAALGVSDPEFTVMPDGAVCMTDLESLVMSSVSCSKDDGQTWLVGNPIASGGPNDRQWLASAQGLLFFTANYFVDHHIEYSRDWGLTWTTTGDVPCSQDLVGNPFNDHLIVGCPDGIAVSDDLGATWARKTVPDRDFGGPRIMTEPAIDSAGNVWMVFQNDEHDIFVAGTPDEGETWPWQFDIAPHFRAFKAEVIVTGAPHEVDAGLIDGNGTYVWPWISAGSDGRFAVSWIGSYDDTASDVQSGPWYLFTATFTDATTARPVVHVSTLTPDSIHDQPICQAGTACQATSVTGDPSGDRRLGDFFETTIDADGFLHAVWSNTAYKPDDVISHPQYVRQTGGLRLIADELLGSWTPTQG